MELFQAKSGQRWHRQWKNNSDYSDCVIEFTDIHPIVILINKNYANCLILNKKVPEFYKLRVLNFNSPIIKAGKFTYTYLPNQDKPQKEKTQ